MVVGLRQESFWPKVFRRIKVIIIVIVIIIIIINVVQKGAEKKLKYKSLCREIQ